MLHVEPMAELKNLKQDGTVVDFQYKFEEMCTLRKEVDIYFKNHIEEISQSN